MLSVARGELCVGVARAACSAGLLGRAAVGGRASPPAAARSAVRRMPVGGWVPVRPGVSAGQCARERLNAKESFAELVCRSRAAAAGVPVLLSVECVRVLLLFGALVTTFYCNIQNWEDLMPRMFFSGGLVGGDCRRSPIDLDG